MIKEDLIAERIVIEVYQQMIRHFADHDPTTRVMVEGILSDEEEHASDLSDLLFITDPRNGETEGEDPGTHPLDMHQDEQSRQQRGARQSKSRESGGNGDSAKRQKSSHHRTLDVPATPRPGGGEKQPQQPNLSGGDKTLLESPERGKAPAKGNNKNRKKRVA
jgi:hypothetical protein